MDESAIRSLISKLTLEEKVQLLTGRDFWHVNGNDEIGLRPMLLSDGPNGVRGSNWDARMHSLNLPSSSALGASWSLDYAARYASVLGREAKRKGADVVLGPTINLHRSPYGGRHFECMSEDPFLTAKLAVSYIKSLQSHNVAACPKHYICNDSETDRLTIDIKVDDQTLNELYLRPFEDSVIEGKAWTIMSSYNSVNGTTLTESDLLTSPLKSEWKFDGVVISDWTAVRSLNSAKKGQDLVMPGPIGPWGEALINAVRSGEIPEQVIDSKVERIIRLAHRTGALGTTTPIPKVEDNSLPQISELEEVKDLARLSTVLLKNDGVLPLKADDLASVGVFGHNADLARTQGGGSAMVMPVGVVSPLQGLREVLGSRVTYAMGAQVFEGIQELSRDAIFSPVDRAPGFYLQFFDNSGEVIFQDSYISTQITWLGGDTPLPIAHSLSIKCVFQPDFSGAADLGFSSLCHGIMKINGVVHLEGKPELTSEDPFQNLLAPPHLAKEFIFDSTQEYLIEIDVDLSNREELALFAMSFAFGFAVKSNDWKAEIDKAQKIAKESDTSIVVVGTNSKVESEGFDRSTLKLPGHQDELVEAVAKVSKKTIVVVNSGSPVLMPWRDKVDGIILTFFGGQEMGHALTDILFGISEPGGRLPTTWPAEEADLPVSEVTPTNGALYYKERLDIGYRAWLKTEAKPAFEFGFGLGYTTWEASVDTKSITMTSESCEFVASVKNTGSRTGRVVIQVYAESLDALIPRPQRWLVGWSEATLEAGKIMDLGIQVDAKEFRYWQNGWKPGRGKFKLLTGFSITDIFQEIDLEIA
jgi:beta-glucosidase